MATTSRRNVLTDVQSLVTQLVSSERATQATRLTVREQKATVQLSAISSLKGALASFKNSVDTLKTSAAFSSRRQVRRRRCIHGNHCWRRIHGQLRHHRRRISPRRSRSRSKAFSGRQLHARWAPARSRSPYGDKSFDVDIDDTKNTLFERPRRHQQGDRKHRRAGHCCSTSRAALAWCSPPPRPARTTTIKIAVSGGDGGLAQLAYSGTDTATMTQMQGAQDAHIKIGSFDHYSDTNVISEAIDGVTINLKKTSTDSVLALPLPKTPRL